MKAKSSTDGKIGQLMKLVIKVEVQCDDDWKKVMGKVASVSGVESISFSRESKSLSIVGKDIEPILIVAKLRKLWRTDIVSVGRKEPTEKKETEEQKPKKQISDVTKKETEEQKPEKQISDVMEVFPYKERQKSRQEVLEIKQQKPNQQISDVMEIIPHKESQDSKQEVIAGSKSSEALAKKLLEMLDDMHETSHVSLQDFGGDTSSSFVQVGRWQVPSKLEIYARKIFLRGGDEFGSAVKTGMIIQNLVFSTLCGAVVSMESTPMELVTESLLLKWRDAIVDAMRLGFKVQFLKDHLLYLGKVFIGKSLLKMNENSEVEIARRRLAMLQQEVASLTELMETI